LPQHFMSGTSDPNQSVAWLGVGFFVLAGLWRLIVWVREAPQKPDPWDSEVERRLEESDAVEICHRCFSPQPPNAWFCEHCGSAVGPYNNWMPYLNVFSEGEVFRNGATDRLRSQPLIIAGYLLFSLSAYVVFAPIFWFFLYKNLKRPMEDDPERWSQLAFRPDRWMVLDQETTQLIPSREPARTVSCHRLMSSLRFCSHGNTRFSSALESGMVSFE